MRAGAIHHIAIKVKDVDGIAAFYRDVLGLEESKRNTDEQGVRSVWLSVSASIIMIERSELGRTDLSERRAFAEDPPGLHLLALTIPRGDRNLWRDHLTRAGCPVVKETEYTIYFSDPEGNRIGLSCWPEA